MKMHMMNTPVGLKPMTDDDYESKKTLRMGEVYEVDIKLARNYNFLKKFHSLIGCAWELMPESKSKAFRTRELFREYCEIAAGFSRPCYTPDYGWVEVAKSISFASMDEDEFKKVYDAVKDVIYNLVLKGYITEEVFDKYLINY